MPNVLLIKSMKISHSHLLLFSSSLKMLKWQLSDTFSFVFNSYFFISKCLVTFDTLESIRWAFSMQICWKCANSYRDLPSTRLISTTQHIERWWWWTWDFLPVSFLQAIDFQWDFLLKWIFHVNTYLVAYLIIGFWRDLTLFCIFFFSVCNKNLNFLKTHRNTFLFTTCHCNFSSSFLSWSFGGKIFVFFIDTPSSFSSIMGIL